MGHSIQPSVEHIERTLGGDSTVVQCVHGVGDGAIWKKYYGETTEKRKERRRLTEENIDKKVEIVVENKSSDTVPTALAAAKQVVVDLSTSLVTCVFTWSRQNPEKKVADFPLADFFGSSSTSIAPAPAAAPAPTSAPAPDVLGGASSLAELDALTVSVTPAPFNINV